MKQEKQNCTIHTMPSNITDADITALFNGIINVVKKKFELDTHNEMLYMANSIERLNKELKSKNAECVRLKNEIISLKSELNNLKT